MKMTTATFPKNSATGYWNMVKHLSTNEKIDLITLLSQSLKNVTPTNISAKKYYGIWGDDGMSDEEFIDEIRSMRNFNRNIVEL
jgi:hypothetical protein